MINYLKLLAAKSLVVLFSLATFAWPNAAQAEDLPEIKYTEPVYKTAGVPASGIDHWVTNSITDYTVVDSDTTTWGESGQTTWYVVTNEVSMGTVDCQGDVRLVLCVGGALSASGYPGIRTTRQSLTIYGQPDGAGSLEAQGDRWSAGIGGHDYNAGGTLTINGGNVTAIGGYAGAGIGGSEEASDDEPGPITIAGGVVTAVGGDTAAAIGFGKYGYGDASVTIVGGELHLTGGTADGPFMNNYGYSPTVFVADGYWTFDVPEDAIAPGRAVYPMSNSKYKCLVAEAGKTFVAQACDALYETFDAAVTAAKAKGTSEGAADIVLIDDAEASELSFGNYAMKIELNGFTLTLDNTISIAGAGGVLSVSDSSSSDTGRVISSGAFTAADGATIAISGGTYGFDPSAMLAPYARVEAGPETWKVICGQMTKEGVTVATSEGVLKYDAETGVITLVGDGATFVATGTNTEGTVNLAVMADKATLKLKDLDIEDARRPVIDFKNDATLTILLEGTNVVSTSANYMPAICVENATQVTVDAAPGCELENAVLEVNGGYYSAAIGSGYYYGNPVGGITIAGGWIVANGGYYGAGIGGACYASSGVITITGGRVEAYGGYDGAGIGGGNYGAGDEITITGGSIVAYGGDYAAGIGGGYSGSGGVIKIKGSSVEAYGGEDAPGLGAGSESAGGVLEFEGDVYAEGGDGADPYGSYDWDDYNRGTIIVGKGSYRMAIEADLVAEGLMLYPGVVGSEYVCEVDVIGVKQVGVKESPTDYAVLDYYATLAEAFAAAESDHAVVLYGPCAENVTTPAGKDVYFDGNGCGYSGTLTVGAGGSLYVLGGKFAVEPSPAWLPEGYHVLQNKDADRIDYPYFVRYAQASVTRGKDTYYYDTINAAFKDCTQGDVVSLMMSGEVDTIAPAVPGIILDLNGYSVSNVYDQAVYVKNVSLTIRDSVGGGRLVGAYEYGVYLANGTLTIESGTIEGAYAGVYVDNYGSSVVNISGGDISAANAEYPAIWGNCFTKLNISGGTFGSYVMTYLESDEYVAQYGTPNGYARSCVDLTGYSGDTFRLRVIGCPNSDTPSPGVAFATGVAYSDSIEPADEDGNTGSAAFDGEMSFAYSSVAKNWSITAPSVSLTWLDSDGLTPLADVSLGSAQKNAQIELPVVYRSGKILTGWYDGSDYWTPQTVYTVREATQFQASWEDVPFSGSGSSSDPFKIKNVNDLVNLAAYANDGGVAAQRLYATFALTANIDVGSVDNWTPVAADYYIFWGATFDGANHVISNLKCTGTGYLGLFGYLSGGTVKNLTLANVAVTNTVTYTDYTESRGTGSVAGWMANGAVVSNCTVSGTVFANYNCCAIAPSVIGTRIIGCNKTACAEVIDVDNTYYGDYILTNVCGYSYLNDAIDVIGRAKGNWVKTTYSDNGYEFRGSGLTGATIGRKCIPMSGGKYTKLIYTVTAGDEPIVDGRIGLSADTMIGDQDDADLGVIRDSDGKIMGLKMINSKNSSAIGNCQYNLYVRGVAGCTDVTTYWYGAYWGKQSYYAHWMEQLSQESADTGSGVYVFNDDGEYEGYKGSDSALCLSWTVNLEPGKTATYACAFGIGEKSDPPRWVKEIELSKDGRTISADAKFTNESGLQVMLYGQCIPDKFHGEKLMDTQLALGDKNPVDTRACIDTAGWDDGLYIFTFWLVNECGAMSESLRRPIQIKDGEIVLDVGGAGYYLMEGEVVSEDKDQFSGYSVKVVALGDPTTEYPSTISEEGVFYALTPKGEYNVIVTATPSDPAKKPVESIVLVHVENDTQDIQVELANPSTRSINSKLVDKTALDSQFHGFLVGDLEQVALKLADTITEGDFTLSILGEDADGTAPHADEMRTRGVRGDEFRDISYVKFAFSVSNETSETTLDETPRTATVVLPFLYARSGELEVYRWNDTVGAMEVITAEPNAKGEYFEVYSDDAVLISIVKGGLYGLAYNLDRHLTVDGVDIGLAQGLGWTCVSNKLVFTGAGEYFWRGTNDVPLKNVNPGGAYIRFTSGATRVSITNQVERPTWLPQGHGWSWNPMTRIGTSYEFDPVAEIIVDKDYPNLYETLDEAVSAAEADGRSVIVARDCAFSALNVSGGRSVTLEGGLFTVTGSLAAITVEAGSTFRIISGTYTFDPSDFVPEGYGFTENVDGTWSVWGKVKLTLIGNGETDPETNFFDIVSGGNLESVPTPVSTNGLAFAGWYRDATYKKQQLPEKPIYEDMTLYAGWGYDVIFNAAGGLFEDGTEEKAESVMSGSLTFPEVTRTGYSLLGWYDAITNGATEITAIICSGTIYARWQAIDKPAGDGYTGTTTPDGGGVTDVKPTGRLTVGDIAIPERVDNSATGKAVVSIANGAYTPKQYQNKYLAPAITSVAIPMYVTEIGNYAFYGNTGLKKVVFAPAYDYVTGLPTEVYIRNQAFANTALTNVTFPAGGAYKLGQLAFADNAQLKDVWLLGDVTLASLDNTPFRNIGTACGGTTFHLSPKKAADAAFVAALTNGVNMASVTIDEEPAGTVEVTSWDVSNDPIVATFTVSDDAPWKTVDETTVSLLYYKDATKISIGDYTQIFATLVEREVDGSYRAEFPKPEGSAGYFTICVGD